jgi:hypothetical protein
MNPWLVKPSGLTGSSAPSHVLGHMRLPFPTNVGATGAFGVLTEEQGLSTRGPDAQRVAAERPSAKAEGFALRLKAGSGQPYGPTSTYTTLKLSSVSSGFWSSMYFFHTSSVTLPLEATQ